MPATCQIYELLKKPNLFYLKGEWVLVIKKDTLFRWRGHVRSISKWRKSSHASLNLEDGVHFRYTILSLKQRGRIEGLLHERCRSFFILRDFSRHEIDLSFKWRGMGKLGTRKKQSHFAEWWRWGSFRYTILSLKQCGGHVSSLAWMLSIIFHFTRPFAPQKQKTKEQESEIP